MYNNTFLLEDMKRLITVIAMIALTGCGKRDDAPVVYTQQDGKKTGAITELDGKVSYQVMGEDNVAPQAQALHQRARVKGQSGDYDGAIALLGEAIVAQPNWPYPHYDMAFTYLLKGDSANALSKYQDVARLAPKGFFTTKTAVWCLEKEKQGTFPAGTYLAYVSLEWTDPNQKAQLVNELATRLPTFTPIWKEKALLADDYAERLRLLDHALSMDADDETYGFLILNKAVTLQQTGQPSAAKALLTILMEGNRTTHSSQNLAREIMKTMKD